MQGPPLINQVSTDENIIYSLSCLEGILNPHIAGPFKSWKQSLIRSCPIAVFIIILVKQIGDTAIYRKLPPGLKVYRNIDQPIGMHEPVISLVRIGQIIDIFAKECPSQPHGPAVIEVIIRMKGNLVLRYLGEPCTGIVDRISWVFFQKIPSFTIPFAVPEKPGIGFRKFQLAKPLAKREFSPRLRVDSRLSV